MRKRVALWTKERWRKPVIKGELLKNIIKHRNKNKGTSTLKIMHYRNACFRFVLQRCNAIRLHTHPEIVHSLADSAVVFWDFLLKILIEAGVHREELWKRWPVVFFS